MCLLVIKVQGIMRGGRDLKGDGENDGTRIHIIRIEKGSGIGKNESHLGVRQEGRG